MENTTKTKVCSRCGRELPITEFYKNDKCADGHIGQCRKCKYEVARERIRRLKQQHNNAAITPPLPHHAPNPNFVDKQPREIIAQVKTLINELRARGYNYEGKLTYLQIINL